MWRALLLASALVASAAGAGAQDDAARAAKAAATHRKIEQIKQQIETLSATRRATTDQRDASVRELGRQEIAIGDVARDIHELDAKLEREQGELDALQQRRSRYEQALARQRQTLAGLLRSAYALGHDEQLKLLLQQDQVASIARVLAYYRYFQRAQTTRIDSLLADLDQLAEVREAIGHKTDELEALRRTRADDGKRLAAERDRRRTLIAGLDAKLADQATRLAVLGKDRKALDRLLEQLRDVFADIPRQLEGAQSFASQRGKLAWPLRGKVLTAFGATDTSPHGSAGWLIAAKVGSDVHAISHGRIVFADWLRGYGLMIIVDHGDGYLSLYGCNEALLKDVGDWVEAGEAIAESGASGGQDTPGVYFELRHRGQPIDPRAWLGK
jgi:septal ring factor EnvC (AmiA/AmiB activator)